MPRGGAATLLRACLLSLSVGVSFSFSRGPSVGASGLRAAGARCRSPGHGPARLWDHGPRRRAPPALCMQDKNGESAGPLRSELPRGAAGAPNEGRRLVSAMAPLALLAAFGLGERGQGEIDKAADVLKKRCAPYIAAVRGGGGRLLYRGGGPPGSPLTPVTEASDLLEDKTYGEVGAAYFANVEIWGRREGGAAPLPSEGHIAVANVQEASRWGEPHSCWPIGAVKYMWLEGSRLLYTDAWPEAAARSWPMATSDMDAFLKGKGVRVSTGLEEALAKGHEVLFVSQGYFLIPAAWEETLQTALQLGSPLVPEKQNPT